MFKILIVDDEILIRYSLTMTFKGTKFSVKTAGTGGEALQAIKEERFDICFLDLHLPDMSGAEVLQTLSCVMPETKIIVMSGDLIEQQMREIVRKHAVLFLEKPFDLDYAKHIVDLIITRRETASIEAHCPDIDIPSARERRRYMRHESNKVITYSTMSFDGEAKAADVEAALKDISDSGMGLVTAQRVEPGSLLTVFYGEVINLGIVRWMAATQPQGPYQIGVQFNVH